nr:MAG TPA: hypothetical protein [Caudoviricetes sp.]
MRYNKYNTHAAESQLSGRGRPAIFLTFFQGQTSLLRT